MSDAMGDAMDTLAEGPDAVPRRKSGRTAKPTPKRVESNLDPSFLGAKAPVAPTQKPEDDDDDLADLDMEEAESDEEPEDQALYCLCQHKDDGRCVFLPAPPRSHIARM